MRLPVLATWLAVFCLFSIRKAESQRFIANITSPGFPNSYGQTATNQCNQYNGLATEQLSFIFRYLYLNTDDIFGIYVGKKSGTVCAKGSAYKSFRGSKLGETFIGFSTSDTSGYSCIQTFYKTASASDNTTANKFHASVYAYQVCPPNASPQTLDQPAFYLASEAHTERYPTGDCGWLVKTDSDSSQRFKVQIELLSIALGHYLELYPIGGKTVQYKNGYKGTVSTSTNSLKIRFNANAFYDPSGQGFLLSYILIGCRETRIPARENAVINNKATFYDAGHRLQYVCIPTWQFESGASAEYVYCDGRDWTWRYDGIPTNCEPIACIALADVPNGNYSLSDGLNGGSIASFSCSEGYTLYGSEKLTCSDSGEWEGSETLPQCLSAEPTTCAPLLPVAHGEWKCVNDAGEQCTSDGSQQQLVCKGNYAPNSTSDVAVCNSVSWANSNLICQAGCCPDLSSEVAQIPNLSVVYDGRCYKNKVLFLCAAGYVLVGQAERECGNSIWEPQAPLPTCKPVDCGPPPKPDDSTTTVSYNSTEYLNEAVYSCKDGDKYELSGPPVLVCQQNKLWSYGTAPVCKMRQCYLADLHIIAPGGVLDPVADYYYVGDNSTLICGNITAPVTCSSKGWSGANVTNKACASALKFLGTISSPGFPSPYSLTATTLFYEFGTAEDERIVYMVDTMFLNDNDTFKLSDGAKGPSSCDSNFVKGYVGSGYNSLVLNDAALTQSNQSCIDFTVVGTKPNFNRYGFLINVYAMHSCPRLEDAYTITEPNFYIASPNYPYLFPTGGECHWLVAPDACSAGQRVAVTVEYLNTAQVARSCLHQLNIGPVNGRQWQLCGLLRDMEVLTDGCVARVHFDARAIAESSNQGFFVSYRVQGCSSDALPLKFKVVLTNPATYYPNGYLAVFRCETGYYFSSGALEEIAQCTVNQWTYLGVDTQCSPRYCNVNFNISNGYSRITGDGSYGTSVEVGCNEGYILVGDPWLNCTETGDWSAQLPSCISESDYRCTKPIIQNGLIFCEDDENTLFCSLDCNQGYYPSADRVYCEKGVFQPVGMKCLPLSCPNITDNDPLVKWVGSSSLVGSLVEFYCPDGYVLDGPSIAICSNSGDWVYTDFGFPACRLTYCDPPPTGLNLEVTYYPELTYGTLAIYSCSSGLHLVGDDKLKCGSMGQWIGTLPYCVTSTCNPKDLLDILKDATVDPTSLVQLSGTASVTCSGTTVQVVCTSSGWNVDPLVLAGCLPNTTESALTLVANSTSPGYPAPYNTSIPFVSASTFSSSSSKNRVVFVTRAVRLGPTDVLSFHIGSASGSQPRCSSAPSQLLRSYGGDNGDIFDVIYSTETACAQFSVAGSTRNDMALGYYFDTLEIRSCPSVLFPAVLTENQFVIVSPNYPRNYVPLESCSWNVVPDSCDVGQLIRATVNYADLGAHRLQFTFDAEPELIELNQTVNNYNFQINGCHLNVLFDASENVYPGRGFEFTYKVGGCAEKTIPTPKDANVNWPQGPYDEGTLVTFECPLGMKFSSGANIEVVECKADGMWKPVGLQSESCDHVLCPVLTEITNGEAVPEVVTGQYGTVVSFKCNEGYVLIGPSSITCQADGKWSGNLPACVLPTEVYKCGQLLPPSNGELNFVSCVEEDCQGHNTVVEISCYPGYQVDGNTNATKCTNGTWTPAVDCTKRCCPNITSLPQPVKPPNVHLQTGSCYQDEVLFSCDTGYTLSGSENIICGADGQWSSAIPSCNIVNCAVPTIPANESLVISVEDISYGSTLNYSCKAGYYLVGQTSATCMDNGKWSGVRPQCEPNQCDLEVLKVLIPDLLIEDEQPPYFFKDTVSVSCGETKLTVKCAEYGWDTVELVSLCLITTAAPRTTLRVITTQPSVYETPRYVMNVTSPNYPLLYPYDKPVVATSVSNGADSKERVVFFVKVANLRTGDSLKLYSKTSASATACYDSNVLKTYNGTTPAGTEYDYVVTSTNVACYLFELGARNLRDAPEPIGFYMDVFSLVDCPAYGSNYKLQAPRFAVASPNYPLNFPLKLRCEWNIAPPCFNQKIKLEFEDFDVRCTNFVDIQGYNKSEAYCGPKPEPIIIDGCSARVRFDSSSSTTASKGFKMVYSLVGCGANQLESRPNATYVPMDFYAVGSTVNYTCNTGYRFKSGNQYERAYCDAFYQWVWLDEPSDCVPVTCPTLTAPQYGSVNVISNEYNGVAYFACQELYYLEGNGTLVCTESGMWNSPPPTCRPAPLLQCPAPPALANSQLNCISNCNGQNAHGTTYQASCRTGYETTVSSADRTIKCYNGTWVPSSIPDCTRICCEPFENIISSSPPPTARNAESTVIIHGSCSNETVDFKCPKAYTLSGASQSICRQDKTWSSRTVPYCLPVKCRALISSDSLVVTSNCDTYECSAAFSCKIGYNLVGENLKTCGETGDWGTLPRCDANMCLVRDLQDQLPRGANVQMSGINLDTYIPYPNTVSVTCYKSTIAVPCGAQAWDLSQLCSKSCEPNYCSTAAIQESLSLANAKLVVSNGVYTLADGESADVTCNTGNTAVARATCGSVSWQTSETLSKIADTCKLPATTQRTEATTRTTQRVTSGMSTTTSSTSTSSGPMVYESCDNSAVIGLAVGVSILAALLIAALVYSYWLYSKLNSSVSAYGKNSEENPTYHDMDTFSDALNKAQADKEQVDVAEQARNAPDAGRRDKVVSNNPASGSVNGYGNLFVED